MWTWNNLLADIPSLYQITSNNATMLRKPMVTILELYQWWEYRQLPCTHEGQPRKPENGSNYSADHGTHVRWGRHALEKCCGGGVWGVRLRCTRGCVWFMHLRKMVKTRWTQVKLFVLSGQKFVDFTTSDVFLPLTGGHSWCLIVREMRFLW